MRREFIFFVSATIAILLLITPIATPSLAVPPRHGEAYAKTEIANPFGLVVAWTKSGAKTVFTDTIQLFKPSSAAWTAGGWHIGGHQQWSWHTSKQGLASHHWYLFHGICLPIVGCIVDQQVQYDAGVYVKIVEMIGNYYCDAYPTGQYSYLVTTGSCI